MIPDVHLQRSLHLIKSGPGPRTCQAWGPLVYYQRGLCHSHQLLWLSWRRSWRLPKGEVLSCVQQGFHPYRHQGVLKGDTLHASTSGWSAKRSTTWIIRISVGRNTILRMYVWRKRRTTSLVAPPIQWKSWLRRLIQNVDSKGWFKRLIQKSEGWFGRLGSQVTDD